MPLIIEDRVKETSTSTGTGAVTLAGAVTGFRRFSDVCSVGDTVYAAIVAVDPSGVPTGQWEIGLYTYSAANTLTRTTVHSSSSNDATVTFSAGTKYVYIDFTAQQIKSLIVTNPDTSLTPYGLSASLFTGIKFQDEFDGSALDTTKWDDKLWYETAPPVSNYSVSNGCLNIWPQRDSSGVWINRGISGKFFQIYGYYEIEAKMPTGAGIIPAFWLTSNDLTTETPTIDGMKSYGASPWEDSSRRFIDWQSTVYGLTSGELGHARASETIGTRDISSGFHKYGVLWEPTGITFYFDGAQIGSKISTTLYKNRMYPILSLFAGTAGSTAGVPTTTTTTEGASNPMRINYIRIWQLINAPAGSDNPSPPSTGGGTTPPVTDTIDWYGDSTVFGWDGSLTGTPQEGTPVATPMPEAFHATAPTTSGVNRGVNGALAEDALNGTNGVPWTNWSTHINSTSAKYVILEYHSHDTEAAMVTRLRTLIQQAKAAGKIVFIQTGPPTLHAGSLTHDQIANASKTAATQENVQVIDIHQYMVDYMAAHGLSMTDVFPDTQHATQQYYTLMGQWAKGEFMALLGNNNSTASPVGQDPSKWTLTFEDHFNGTTLDTTVWTPNGGPLIEPSTPNTWRVANGNLELCYQNPFKRGNCSIITNPGANGIVGFQQTYGFFEARIKLPYGQNAFPAFWLFRNDTREFDIVECFGGSGASWVTSDFHPINAGWTIHKDQTIGDVDLADATLAHDYYKTHTLAGSFPYGWLGTNVLDLSADYHTYAMEWLPTGIRFFFDGQVIKGANGAYDPYTARASEFNVPMYIILDFWMEGNGPGSMPTGFGAWDMKIDYVRVWQHV